MDKGDILRDASNLTPAERILLVEEIWDSLSIDPDRIPVTKNHQRELDRRLVNLRKSPRAGSDWKTARARIVHRK
jgi:putative addiction module component (TIGR02574 family)